MIDIHVHLQGCLPGVTIGVDNVEKNVSQKHLQLDREEMAGKMTLIKRVSAGKIHVGPSYKGKGIVVMSTDMYHEMSVTHTEGDLKVGGKEFQETQREDRGHSRVMARIVSLGKGGGNANQGRCYDNISSWACDPPVLRCVAKAHKEVGPKGFSKSYTKTESCFVLH